MTALTSSTPRLVHPGRAPSGRVDAARRHLHADPAARRKLRSCVFKALDQADHAGGPATRDRRAWPGPRGCPTGLETWRGYQKTRLGYLVAGICWGELCKYIDAFARGDSWTGPSGDLALVAVASLFGRPIHIDRYDANTGRTVRATVPPLRLDGHAPVGGAPIDLSERHGRYRAVRRDPALSATTAGPLGAVAAALAVTVDRLRRDVTRFLEDTQEALAHEPAFQRLLLEALPAGNQRKVTDRLLDEYVACIGGDRDRSGDLDELVPDPDEHFSISA